MRCRICSIQGVIVGGAWALWLTLALLFIAPSAEAADGNMSEMMSRIERGDLKEEQIPNPHWDSKACQACHIGNPDDLKFRKSDLNELCNSCHDVTSVATYIHAVGMKPPPSFEQRMPAEFKKSVERSGGVVSCTTCHDMTAQCLADRSDERGLNPRFFRGGPYVSRTDLCFNCHEKENYERFNPHDQITDEGVLDGQRCFVCHSATPDRKRAQGPNDVQFQVVENLSQLCTGCHPWRMHPGGSWARFASRSKGVGPNHLVVPTPAVKKRIENIEAGGEEILPLDPITGTITCATCHNPHERGVQFLHKADVGADGIRRLRRDFMEICVTCHDK